MEGSNASLPLLIAAGNGDVDFLLQALATDQPAEYFLATEKESNIIHQAVNREQAEFLKEVLDRLPNSIVQHLLCQQVVSINNYNAFHIAALRRNLTVVQLLVKFAKQSTPSSSSGPSTSNSKPWLALDKSGKIPFQVALAYGFEDIALELMTLDLEWICQFHYNSGASHLVEALRIGCSKVAKAIMNSGCSYSTEGDMGLTPLDVAPNCSDEILELILEKHPEMINHRDIDGFTFLHKWVEIGEVWPFQFVVKRAKKGGWLNEFINLLCMVDNGDSNPLHIAAAIVSEETAVKITQVLVEAYKSGEGEIILPLCPWRRINKRGLNPLLIALYSKHESLATYYISLDFVNLVATSRNSILYASVLNNCDQAVQIILGILQSIGKHTPLKLDDGVKGINVLHIAWKCEEETARLLIENFPNLINKKDDRGSTPLDTALENGTPWLIKLLIEKGSSFRYSSWIEACKEEETATLLFEKFPNLIHENDDSGRTPLDIALENGTPWLIRLLLEKGCSSFNYSSWKKACEEEETATLLFEKFPNLFNQRDDSGRTPLDIALEDETTWLIKLLIEKGYPLNQDNNGKTPLDKALENGTVWLINLLLEKGCSFQNGSWITACEEGKVDAVKAIIDGSPDFRTRCIDARDSPLHHIQLTSYQHYLEFLQIPMMQDMKDMTDSNNNTPLHIALQRRDLKFAEALLFNDVSSSIINNGRKTATQMLADLYHEKHAESVDMCNRLHIDPTLIVHYVPLSNTMGVGAGIPGAERSSSVEKMRGTLSVVAGLLTTLTFAAGFTLPVGLNDDTGETFLAKKASFLAFVVADTYAMCCSMLVLFYLMWSMLTHEKAKSLYLVDRSVLILMQGLYGALVAFMTGAFTVLSQKSLGASIFVIVMCCIVAVLTNNTVVEKFLDMFIFVGTERARRNQTAQSLEEGTALTSSSGEAAVASNENDNPPSSAV